MRCCLLALTHRVRGCSHESHLGLLERGGSRKSASLTGLLSSCLTLDILYVESNMEGERFWFLWRISPGGNKVVGDEVQSERLKRQCRNRRLDGKNEYEREERHAFYPVR